MKISNVTPSAVVIFFFSSRRRHTRYIGDWSSDVCSSDLSNAPTLGQERIGSTLAIAVDGPHSDNVRSEERRVGKECRSRGWADGEKKRRNDEERRHTAGRWIDEKRGQQESTG